MEAIFLSNAARLNVVGFAQNSHEFSSSACHILSWSRGTHTMPSGMGVFRYIRFWKSVTGATGAVGSFVFDASGLRGMSCAWIVPTNKRNPKT
jgi:hypothetical protein